MADEEVIRVVPRFERAHGKTLLRLASRAFPRSRGQKVLESITYPLSSVAWSLLGGATVALGWHNSVGGLPPVWLLIAGLLSGWAMHALAMGAIRSLSAKALVQIFNEPSRQVLEFAKAGVSRRSEGVHHSVAWSAITEVVDDRDVFGVVSQSGIFFVAPRGAYPDPDAALRKITEWRG